MLPKRSNSGFKRQSSTINRGMIAETGVIPAGFMLIRDSFPFQIIDKKETVVEDAHGREIPILRATGLIQNGDTENANGRYYPTAEVLAPAVRNIQDDISSRAVLGEFDHPCICVHDIRVLTTEGWKEFLDIKVGDYVWSRVGGKMVKSRVNNITNEPYDGTAYRISGRNINIEFTPGHRFLFEKRPDQKNNTQIYATVADIFQNRKKYSHCRIPTTAEYNIRQSSIVTIPATKREPYPDCYNGNILNDLVFDARDFASFLGLYLAEGSLNNNGVQIDQTNLAGRELIENLLNRMDLKFTTTARGFYISADKRLADYLRPLGDKYSKYIPQAIKDLSADCLEKLVYWFAIGDGRMLTVEDRHGSYTNCKSQLARAGTTQTLDLGTYSRLAIFTTSKRLIQDLHECVVKAGYSGRLSEVVTEDDYVFAEHVIKAEDKRTLYQLHISRNKGFTLDPRFTSIEPFHHVGRIYCLSVDHGNFYMEHKGMSFWTGNSDAKIHLDRVSHLMSKVWMEGKKVFGEMEVLHRLPCGAALRGLFEHKVRVGISSRGVGDMEMIERNGHEVYRVMPGYAFVTWDTVAEPSVDGAILTLREGLNRKLKPLAAKRHLFNDSVYQAQLVEAINQFFGLKDRKTYPVRGSGRR